MPRTRGFWAPSKEREKAGQRVVDSYENFDDTGDPEFLQQTICETAGSERGAHVPPEVCPGVLSQFTLCNLRPRVDNQRHGGRTQNDYFASQEIQQRNDEETCEWISVHRPTLLRLPVTYHQTAAVQALGDLPFQMRSQASE